MQVTTFQLDKCANDADLADDCNAEGQCTVYRYPRRLEDAADEVMLPDVFARSTTLLTFDRSIIEDNPGAIVAPNPGIIVIQKMKPHPPLTAHRAKGIIGQAKQRIPSWTNIDWSMVYAEINEEEIYVCPLVDADISKGRPFRIASEAVDAEVREYIAGIHESLGRLGPSDNAQ